MGKESEMSWDEIVRRTEEIVEKQKREFAERMAKAPEDFKYKYSGNLELYYETGFEGMHAVILHDDRGNHVGPKYDNPNETMTYKSLSWAHFFSKRDPIYLVVQDPDGKEIFRGHVYNDRQKLHQTDYHISFAPVQVELKDWMSWVLNEYRATVFTDDPVLSEDSAYQDEMKKNERKISQTR